MGDRSVLRVDILSEKERRALPVLEITESATCIDGMVVSGGIMDARLGPSTRMPCATCGLECDGHYGILKFGSTYFLNPLFVREIVQILRLICLNSKCSAFMCDVNAALDSVNTPEGRKVSKHQKAWAASGKSMLSKGEIEKLAKHVSNVERACPRCQTMHAANLSWSATSHCVVMHGGEQGASGMLSGNEIRSIFANMSETTMKRLKLRYKPTEYLMNSLLIPPLNARTDEHCDLNKLLSAIVRWTHSLESIDPKQQKRGREEVQMRLELLMINKEGRAIEARSEPFNSLMHSKDEKHGTMRGNCQGRRMNLCARGVLAGDPYSKPGEIGIPFSAANTLPVLCRVNARNISYYQDILHSGNQKYQAGINETMPSILTITRRDGEFLWDMESFRGPKLQDVVLQEGDTVERTLEKGDVVTFNRQPTLWRKGLISLRAILVPFNSFRFNFATMEQLNADCDGDEGNVFITPGDAPRAEQLWLMSMEQNVLSDQAPGSIIGVGHGEDVLATAFTLTAFPSQVNPCDAYNAYAMSQSGSISWVPLPFERDVTGVQLIEAILRKYPFTWKDEEGGVLIENGIIVRGALTKKHLGSGGGVIHRIAHRHGGRAACSCIHELQLLLHSLTKVGGHTISTADVFSVGDEIDSQISAIADAEVDPMEKEKQLKLLAEDMLRNSPSDDCLAVMINSRSKGKVDDYMQMVLGMGTIFDNDRETFSNESLARGIFDTAIVDASRGVTATSQKKLSVRDSGAAQRQLVKMLEEVKQEYDLNDAKR